MTLLTEADSTTAVITRDVRTEREHDYLAWVNHVNVAAARFPGYQGAIMLKPTKATPERHTLIHRFVDERTYQHWKTSEALAQLLQEANGFSVPSVQTASGLETWFAVPERDAIVPPPRWKMCLTTIPAGYVLSSIIAPGVHVLVPNWPFLVSNGMVTLLLVVALTYLGMPLMARLLHPWLYPEHLQGTKR